MADLAILNDTLVILLYNHLLIHSVSGTQTPVSTIDREEVGQRNSRHTQNKKLNPPVRGAMFKFGSILGSGGQDDVTPVAAVATRIE